MLKYSQEPGHDSRNFMYIDWPVKYTYVKHLMTTCVLLTKRSVDFYLEENPTPNIIICDVKFGS